MKRMEINSNIHEYGVRFRPYLLIVENEGKSKNPYINKFTSLKEIHLEI